MRFHAFRRYHEYFDTGEYITHVLRKNGERIVNLPAWVPCETENRCVEFVDGSDTNTWQNYWLRLVAKYGIVIDKFAFHGFFGTFVQVNDIYGMRDTILRRNIDTRKLNHNLRNNVMNYDLLVDQRSLLTKICSQFYLG